MRSESPFLLRPAFTAPRVLLWLGGGVAVTACLQYAWLFADTPLAFRVWGFTFIAAYFVPLPFLVGMYRLDVSSLSRLRVMVGSPSRWLISALLLVAALASPVLLHLFSGGEYDPSWKWTTLALSGGLDLPLTTLQLLPMFMVQDLFWRQSIEQAFSSRHFFVQILVSVLFWTLANGVMLVHMLLNTAAPMSFAFVLLCVSTGAFVFTAQRGSSFLLSATAMTCIATAVYLLFGNQVELLNHTFFGLDVAEIDGLFPEKMNGREGYALLMGVALFVAAILVPRKMRKTR